MHPRKISEFHDSLQVHNTVTSQANFELKVHFTTLNQRIQLGPPQYCSAKWSENENKFMENDVDIIQSEIFVRSKES